MVVSLRRSPFKIDTIEYDPNGFGLRVQEIIACAEALYNYRSILISGPRGIGKSSLGYQMQKVLEGDTTLFKRCGISTTFPSTLCLFHACNKEESLDQLVLDIIDSLEQKITSLRNASFQGRLASYVEDIASFELSLGPIKAILKDSHGEKQAQVTVAKQFFSVLSKSLQHFQKHKLYDGINIMVDELDQLSADISFGHFMKVMHETLVNTDHRKFTFILAGQQGIYTRLNTEDASFERIVRHVPLSTLDIEASEYILKYAASHASPIFNIDTKALKLILALSSGYPYVIHLIGNAAFWAMEDDLEIHFDEVMNGVEVLLKSDKREKYLERLRHLSSDQQRVIITMSDFQPSTIPAEIPVSWVIDKLSGYFVDTERIQEVLRSLIQSGYLTFTHAQTYCRFAEELFRVFVSLLGLEQRVGRLRRAQQEDKIRKEQIEIEELISQISSGRLDYWQDLDEGERQSVIKKTRKLLKESRYRPSLAIDDILTLAPQRDDIIGFSASRIEGIDDEDTFDNEDDEDDEDIFGDEDDEDDEDDEK